MKTPVKMLITAAITAFGLSILSSSVLAKNVSPPMSKSDIPRPASIEVTRDNYQRVVGMLKDKGLDRKGIKRWINASVKAHKNHDTIRPVKIRKVVLSKAKLLKPKVTRIKVRNLKAIKPVRMVAVARKTHVVRRNLGAARKNIRPRNIRPVKRVIKRLARPVRGK